MNAAPPGAAGRRGDVDWSASCAICASPWIHGQAFRAIEDGRLGRTRRRSPPRGASPHACPACEHVLHLVREDGRAWDEIPDPPPDALVGHVVHVGAAVALARACRGRLSEAFLSNMLRNAPWRDGERGAILGRDMALCRVLLVQEGRCAYCRTPVTPGNATLDHRDPTVRGGSQATGNLSWCCAACNKLKGALNAREYLAMLAHERPPAIASVLEAQRRWRAAEGLDDAPQRAAEAGWTRPCRDTFRRQASERLTMWAVGGTARRWEVGEDGTARAHEAAAIVENPAARASRQVGLRAGGRDFLVYRQTFREAGLPFEDTLGKRTRWLPDALVERIGEGGVAGLLATTVKQDYLRSFMA